MGGATTFGERAKPAKPSIIFTVSSDLHSTNGARMRSPDQRALAE
jgi:hypothetical protein